jgi:eukaryotic-like serine/threonine-protein kinase
MTWESSPNAQPSLPGNGKGKQDRGSSAIGLEVIRPLPHGNTMRIARTEAHSLLALSQSLGFHAQNSPQVLAALEAYLEAIQRGQPCSRKEFLDQHPEIAGELSECLSGLEYVQAVAPIITGSQPFSPALISTSSQLGDYRILREVGRGGMAVVYEAEQISLGRRVALKVLPFAAAIDPKQRQRFQIEAQAAAQLHHPHIVPIFGVGCEHGIHYYAMQFVEGRSLAALIQELRSRYEAQTVPIEPVASSAREQPDVLPATADKTADVSLHETTPDSCACGADQDRHSHTDSDRNLTVRTSLGRLSRSFARAAQRPAHLDRDFCRKIAQLGIEAAEALDHAHGLGIVHRDIKPANLLIDPEGSLWITDFGLARYRSDLSLTHTGDMIGTLRYMSPEQALARRGVVDQRTDIYSLGVTLYEVLTLRLAFDGRDHQELLRQIALDEPILPRRLNPAVPSDLETIVLKAMAKEPANRYATAQELAADLRRFLEDKPIKARRPGPLEHGLRWASRHRELVATAAGIFALAIIISTGAVWSQARKTDAANRSHHAYLIETFPLLDAFAMESMRQASMLFSGRTDPENWEEAIRVCQRALTVYKDASELPPDDLESRAIIARSYSRLGFTRSILSGANAKKTNAASGQLSQAEVDYRQSLALFEKLHAEFPDDAKVRRYFADAEGMSGWGWLLEFMQRAGEAEPHYRRSVELWRGLVRDPGARNDSAVAARSSENVASELSDLSSLAVMIQTLTKLLEDSGRASEAEDLREQLDNDIEVLAARFIVPEERQNWAKKFMRRGSAAWSRKEEGRLSASLFYRLVTIFEPANADAHNGLAWAMMSVPGASPLPASLALASAQKAVELQPKNWMYWNTLGVTAFRSKDWKSATAALRESISLNEGGGGAIDFFFLAMTFWHEGKTEDARMYFKKGEGNYLKNNPGDTELRQLYLEASDLMGLPTPMSERKPAHADMRKEPTETAEKEQLPASENPGPICIQARPQRSSDNTIIVVI